MTSKRLFLQLASVVWLWMAVSEARGQWPTYCRTHKPLSIFLQSSPFNWVSDPGNYWNWVSQMCDQCYGIGEQLGVCTVCLEGHGCSFTGCGGEVRCCTDWDPLIVNLGRGRVRLTDLEGGVVFDADSDGRPEMVSWTETGAEVAFLALDRNRNGRIDGGVELIGNTATSEVPLVANGFEALAVFDEPSRGGNGDGRITEEDSIYSRLLSWVDLDHDGRSRPSELHSLESRQLRSIALAYDSWTHEDGLGNRFQYRSRARFTGSRRTPWIFDVILQLSLPLDVELMSSAP